MIRPTRSPLLAAAAALVAGAPLGAQTVYSGTGATAAAQAAAFLGTVRFPAIEHFDALPDGQLVVTFAFGDDGTATLANGFGVTSAYPYGGVAASVARGYGAYAAGGIGSDPIFTFSRPIAAFGAYFADVEATDVLRVSLVGGGEHRFALPITDGGGVSFLGVRYGANLITGLTVDLASNDAILLDDVIVADRAILTSPEPGTWALLATGLLGVAATARRRRAVT
jgi:hypothetical protein